MKIYTRTGDEGETGLFGGPRVPKFHPRIEAYGAVDELNSFLGAARLSVGALDAAMDVLLAQIQNDLFDLGAELATPEPGKTQHSITQTQITALERAIDQYDETLPALKQFILPGGSPAGAQLHLARTVCRRAERQVVYLATLVNEHVSPEAVIYLNRLSDLLFVLARAANQAAGIPDVPWQKLP
jgi:cob(I)alamin adenosyltransferase